MSANLDSLDALVRGLEDPVHDTQACFRVLLDALARPGTIGVIDVAVDQAAARQWPEAAFAALLTIADYSTPIWLQEHDAALAQALRFHTGAPLTGKFSGAVLGYVTNTATLSSLDALALGTPETPQASITLFIRVEALEGGPLLTLSGPGIKSSLDIAPTGIPDRFWKQRKALEALAPCGVDCYLVCGRKIVGLPRTTNVEIK
ncbi:phosphonate C-P lyase system protein PhnH [Paraburkholderia aspalathi]|uniref:Alpha-D-ribose 1-methylphosphonate 5-triphosphate synthase subunit PhnH n=1 Tax=Paraburkholderia aspalathi TaxID=1324617 RepID=A0A1I7B8G8_9BURK|nr:phosphonate C-P lyase system protein PhnH [Paraburkholderia aspalathi]SFT83493.1 alpha-D-ribose 1-methylphosphonate 5-triphosphate synthase subunit PhnH [Paraburkholderia aspalathi]